MSEVIGELRQTVRALLLDLPRVSDQLLLASDTSLNLPTGWPSWLLLRRLRFTWHCLIQHSGNSTRFLVWNRKRSARDLLTAEVTLDVEPTPHDEPTPAEHPTEPSPASPPPAYPQAVAHATLPAMLVRNPTPSQQRLLPPGTDPASSVLLEIGPAEFWGFGVPDADDLEADDIAARWTWRGQARDLPAGRDQPWTVLPFLRLATALSGPRAAETGAFQPLPTRLPPGPLWDLVEESLAAPGRACAALDLGWQATPAPPGLPAALRALRTRWALGRLQARVNPLVTTAGNLAEAGDDDTFTMPFHTTVTAAGSLQAQVAFQFPDLIYRGEAREALIDAFTGEARKPDGSPRFRRAVDAVRRAAEAAGVPEAVAATWLRGGPLQAAILRVQRNRRDDQLLLGIQGSHQGRHRVLTVWLRDVAWNDNGELDDVSDLASARGGNADDLELGWREGKAACCGFLLGLLRWRRLLL